MTRDHINPLLWNQSVGIARQTCARIFRDGGSPADALAAFGLGTTAERPVDWSQVVELVAEIIASTPVRRAA